MAARRLILLGPPGTGKGTQAKRLESRFGLVPMSSGDTLRREIQAGSEIGRQAVGFVSAGRLVPDDVITGVMLTGIRRYVAGFVLDGFPRTIVQAEALDRGLAELGFAIDAVLDMHMSDAAIIDRIVSRRVCSRCGFTYNVRFFPPKAEGVCDHCGGPVIQRVDDREDVIATRLDTYRAQTAPLEAYYSARGLLRIIDAAASAPEVERQVMRVVDSESAE